MSKGFQSPNHTQVPNDLFDSEMAKMAGGELKVVLSIIRQTLGFHRKQVKYSIAELAAMTGLSRQAVVIGARQAEDHGLIKRINPDDIKKAEWKLILHPLKIGGVDPLEIRGLDPLESRGVPSKNKRGTLQKLEGIDGVKESIKESIKEINKPDLVDAILDQDRKSKDHWPGREKMPENYRALMDQFVKCTGIKPINGQINDWFSTASDWVQIGAHPQDITEAFKRTRPDHNGKGGYPILRPGSLTGMLQAVIGERSATPHQSQLDILKAAMIKHQQEIDNEF